MSVQDAMKLTDSELIKLGIEEIKKFSMTYQYFESTKEFANRCKKLIEENNNAV